MKVGDLVKFSRQHTSTPGLDYCDNWKGIVLSVSDEKVTINWFSGVHPKFGISHYDDTWRRQLTYAPFEVFSEGR